MAITFEKTWQFNVNQSLPTSGGYAVDRQALMLAIKNTLIGFPTSPWQVVGSSDAVTAGMDAVDRWNVPGDIISATSTNPRSWMVLYQPGLDAWLAMGRPYWTDPRWNNIVLMRTLPVNGPFTTTMNPSAPGEAVLGLPNGYLYDGGSTTAVNHRLHGMQSTDGKCTRIFVTDSANEIGFFGQFDELVDVPAPMVSRKGILASWIPGNNVTTKISYSELVRNDTLNAHQMSFPVGLAPYTKKENRFATEHTGTTPLGEHASLQGPNGIDGGEVLTTMHPMLVDEQEIYGRVPDMWFGPNTNPHGSVYPAAGPIVAAQFQDIVLPWPNSTPVLV